MRHGGGFRLLGALLVVGVIAALTAGAYSAGCVAGAGSTCAPSMVVPPYCPMMATSPDAVAAAHVAYAGFAVMRPAAL